MTGIVVMALALVVGRGQFHPSEVLHALTEIGPCATVAAAGLVMIQILLLATRLWAVFPGAPRPSWPRVAYGFCVGQLLNNVIRRSGDVAKVLLVASPASRPGPGRAETAGVVVFDKVVDLTVLSVAFAWAGRGTAIPASGTWSTLAIVAVLGAVMGAALVLRKQSAIVARVVAGMRVARDPRRLAAVAAMAMASWSAEIVALHVLASMLGFDLGVADAVRCLVLLNLGVAIPLSAANLGTFEVSLAFGLHAAGLSLDEGLAIGAAYHVIQLLAIVLCASSLALVRRSWSTAFEPEVS